MDTRKKSFIHQWLNQIYEFAEIRVSTYNFHPSKDNRTKAVIQKIKRTLVDFNLSYVRNFIKLDLVVSQEIDDR